MICKTAEGKKIDCKDCLNRVLLTTDDGIDCDGVAVKRTPGDLERAWQQIKNLTPEDFTVR